MNPAEATKDADGQADAPDTPTTAATAVPTDMAAALPSLDESVAQRCAELGIDPDFQRQSDWLAEYKETFDLDLESRATSPANAVGQASEPSDNISLVDPAEMRQHPTDPSARQRLSQMLSRLPSWTTTRSAERSASPRTTRRAPTPSWKPLA